MWQRRCRFCEVCRTHAHLMNLAMVAMVLQADIALLSLSSSGSTSAYEFGYWLWRGRIVIARKAIDTGPIDALRSERLDSLSGHAVALRPQLLRSITHLTRERHSNNGSKARRGVRERKRLIQPTGTGFAEDCGAGKQKNPY